MDHRAELVHLITDGTPPPDIIRGFRLRGLHPKEIDILLSDCGVQFAKRTEFHDGISDERRAYLQELVVNFLTLFAEVHKFV